MVDPTPVPTGSELAQKYLQKQPVKSSTQQTTTTDTSTSVQPKLAGTLPQNDRGGGMNPFDMVTASFGAGLEGLGWALDASGKYMARPALGALNKVAASDTRIGKEIRRQAEWERAIEEYLPSWDIGPVDLGAGKIATGFMPWTIAADIIAPASEEEKVAIQKADSFTAAWRERQENLGFIEQMAAEILIDPTTWATLGSWKAISEAPFMVKALANPEFAQIWNKAGVGIKALEEVQGAPILYPLKALKASPRVLTFLRIIDEETYQKMMNALTKISPKAQLSSAYEEVDQAVRNFFSHGGQSVVEADDAFNPSLRNLRGSAGKQRARTLIGELDSRVDASGLVPLTTEERFALLNQWNLNVNEAQNLIQHLNPQDPAYVDIMRYYVRKGWYRAENLGSSVRLHPSLEGMRTFDMPPPTHFVEAPGVTPAPAPTGAGPNIPPQPETINTVPNATPPSAQPIAPQTPTPRPFNVTDDWQEVPDGSPLPPGVEVRMDTATGKNFARRAQPPQRPAPAPAPQRTEAWNRFWNGDANGPAMNRGQEVLAQFNHLSDDEERRFVEEWVTIGQQPSSPARTQQYTEMIRRWDTVNKDNAYRQFSVDEDETPMIRIESYDMPSGRPAWAMTQGEFAADLASQYSSGRTFEQQVLYDAYQDTAYYLGVSPDDLVDDIYVFNNPVGYRDLDRVIMIEEGKPAFVMHVYNDSGTPEVVSMYHDGDMFPAGSPEFSDAMNRLAQRIHDEVWVPRGYGHDVPSIETGISQNSVAVHPPRQSTEEEKLQLLPDRTGMGMTYAVDNLRAHRMDGLDYYAPIPEGLYDSINYDPYAYDRNIFYIGADGELDFAVGLQPYGTHNGNPTYKLNLMTSDEHITPREKIKAATSLFRYLDSDRVHISQASHDLSQDSAKIVHRQLVKQAIQDGEQVSDEVMAQYPGLRRLLKTVGQQDDTELLAMDWPDVERINFQTKSGKPAWSMTPDQFFDDLATYRGHSAPGSFQDEINNYQRIEEDIQDLVQRGIITGDDGFHIYYTYEPYYRFDPADAGSNPIGNMRPITVTQVEQGQPVASGIFVSRDQPEAYRLFKFYMSPNSSTEERLATARDMLDEIGQHVPTIVDDASLRGVVEDPYGFLGILHPRNRPPIQEGWGKHVLPDRRYSYRNAAESVASNLQDRVEGINDEISYGTRNIVYIHNDQAVFAFVLEDDSNGGWYLDQMWSDLQAPASAKMRAVNALYDHMQTIDVTGASHDLSIDSAPFTHRWLVKEAIDAGEDVPEEVLKHYPGLRRLAQKRSSFDNVMKQQYANMSSGSPQGWGSVGGFTPTSIPQLTIPRWAPQNWEDMNQLQADNNKFMVPMFSDVLAGPNRTQFMTRVANTMRGAIPGVTDDEIMEYVTLFDLGVRALVHRSAAFPTSEHVYSILSSRAIESDLSERVWGHVRTTASPVFHNGPVQQTAELAINLFTSVGKIVDDTGIYQNVGKELGTFVFTHELGHLLHFLLPENELDLLRKAVGVKAGEQFTAKQLEDVAEALTDYAHNGLAGMARDALKNFPDAQKAIVSLASKINRLWRVWRQIFRLGPNNENIVKFWDNFLNIEDDNVGSLLMDYDPLLSSEPGTDFSRLAAYTAADRMGDVDTMQRLEQRAIDAANNPNIVRTRADLDPTGVAPPTPTTSGPASKAKTSFLLKVESALKRGDTPAVEKLITEASNEYRRFAYDALQQGRLTDPNRVLADTFLKAGVTEAVPESVKFTPTQKFEQALRTAQQPTRIRRKGEAPAATATVNDVVAQTVREMNLADQPVNMQIVPQVQDYLMAGARFNPDQFEPRQLWQDARIRTHLERALIAQTSREAQVAVSNLFYAMNLRNSGFGVMHPVGARLMNKILPETASTVDNAGPQIFSPDLVHNAVQSDKDVDVITGLFELENVQKFQDEYEKGWRGVADVLDKYAAAPTMNDQLTARELNDALEKNLITDEKDRKIVERFLKRYDMTQEAVDRLAARARKNRVKMKDKSLDAMTVQDAYLDSLLSKFFKEKARDLGIDLDDESAKIWKTLGWVPKAWREQALVSVRYHTANIMDMTVKSMIYGINPLTNRGSRDWALRVGMSSLPNAIFVGRDTRDLSQIQHLAEFAGEGAPVALRPLAPVIRFNRHFARATENSFREWAWQNAMKDHLHSVRPQFDKEIRRMMPGTNGVDLIHDLDRQGSDMFRSEGIEFSPDQLRDMALARGAALPQAEELALTWSHQIDEASNAGIQMSDKVHFNYDKTYAIEDKLGLKYWLPFHFFATRNLPFYLETLAANPELINAWMAYQDVSEQDRINLGLPSEYNGFLLMDGFLDGLFGPGKVFFNPFAALSFVDQTKKFDALNSPAQQEDEFGPPKTPYNKLVSGVGRQVKKFESLGFSPAPWINIPMSVAGFYGPEDEPMPFLRLSGLFKAQTSDAGALQRGLGVPALNNGEGYELGEQWLRDIERKIREKTTHERVETFSGSRFTDNAIVSRLAERAMMDQQAQPDADPLQIRKAYEQAAREGPGNVLWDEAAREVRRVQAASAQTGFWFPLPTKQRTEENLEITTARTALGDDLLEQLRNDDNFKRFLQREGSKLVAYTGYKRPYGQPVDNDDFDGSQVAIWGGTVWGPDKEPPYNNYMNMETYLMWLQRQPEGSPRSPEAFFREYGIYK